MHTCERLRASRVAPCACCTRAVVYAARPPRRGVRARLARRQVRMHAHTQLLSRCLYVAMRTQAGVAVLRLSSAVLQPSIACASYLCAAPSPPRCRETVCMSPGAPAHMRAAASWRTYARAAARAQPVHIHGFSCTLPRLHRDDAESGS
jgi:hypothetical protein